MAKQSAPDPRLARVTQIALALPEAARQICSSHAQFLVRKKTFAYSSHHHGRLSIAVQGAARRKHSAC